MKSRKWQGFLVLLSGYIGIRGYDYYQIRREKQRWLGLLEERVGKRMMSPTEPLRHVNVLLTSEGRKVFYDYTKPLLKYVDYDVKEISMKDEDVMKIFREQLNHPSDGLIVIGSTLFRSLIECFRESFEQEEEKRVNGSYSNNSSWWNRWFKIKKPNIMQMSKKFPICGYLPLNEDLSKPTLYSKIRHHFTSLNEARNLLQASFTVADGYNVKSVYDILSSNYEPNLGTIPEIVTLSELDKKKLFLYSYERELP
jgi:hypothetical protein